MKYYAQKSKAAPSVSRLPEPVRERDVLRRTPERIPGTLAGQRRRTRIRRGLAEIPQAFSCEQSPMCRLFEAWRTDACDGG